MSDIFAPIKSTEESCTNALLEEVHLIHKKLKKQKKKLKNKKGKPQKKEKKRIKELEAKLERLEQNFQLNMLCRPPQNQWSEFFKKVIPNLIYFAADEIFLRRRKPLQRTSHPVYCLPDNDRS